MIWHILDCAPSQHLNVAVQPTVTVARLQSQQELQVHQPVLVVRNMGYQLLVDCHLQSAGSLHLAPFAEGSPSLGGAQYRLGPVIVNRFWLV